MKSDTHLSTRATLLRLAALAVTAGASAHAAIWTGTTGSFADPANWDTTLVPVAGESVTLANQGTIQVPAGVSAPLSGALNGVTINDGTLSINGGTLTLTGTIANGGFGVTSISSGIVTGSTFGAGGVATNGGLSVSSLGGTWSISGGNVNLNGISANGGSQSISGGSAKAQDLRNTGSSTLTVSAGTHVIGKFIAGSSGTGQVVVSGTAVVNQNLAGQAAAGSNNECWVGNNTSTGSLTLEDDAQWNYSFYNANSSVNFGRGSGNHVFTIRENASFTTAAGTGALKAVVVGDTNGSARGTVNLDGGTLTVLGLHKGSGSGVINANGTLVRAAGSSANFFTGFTGTGGAANTSNSVNLLAGGLRFDSNSFDAATSSPLSGSGGVEKLGSGSLTLTGACSYTGDTTVTAGTLVLGTAFLHDDSRLTVANGALADLAHGIEDVVDELVLGGTLITSGTWGSSSSAAANVNDTFFTGTGVIRVGEPATGRDLVWTGAENSFWGGFPDLNFIDPLDTAVAFATNDNVTFDDSSTVTTVLLSGPIQAGVVTFAGMQDWIIDGAGSGFAGGASFVMNQTGTVTLGGTASNFTGGIAVNSGVLKMGDNAAFGATSGISIAAGAQVDLNGKAPGSIHSYTLAGPGPGGAGAIINSSATALFSTGGVKNLTLTADATVGSSGGRFDVGAGGTITGNGHTLTKTGTSEMAFRGDASGTPIDYLIAGGTVWAENTALAYGGATGTLTVQSGARAGTFGNHTIVTPVTLQSGGTLHNQGAGTGTWDGAFALQGDVTFDAGGGAIVINGTISGTANVTKTGANNVTFSATALPGNAGHGGNTTVSAGRLILAAAALADDSDVVIAAGATLNLAHSDQDTVDTLTLSGTPAAAGIWGAVGSGAPFESDRLEGSGTLLVTTGGVADPYDTWAAQISDPDDRDRADDADGDGFTNEEEFLFGTSPVAGNGSLVAATRVGSNLIVRWNERTTGASYELQESTTMAETPWPASGVTPAVAADQSGVPADYLRMEATVPINGSAKFLRVSSSED